MATKINAKRPTFSSKYGSKINDALNTVTDFKYDPMKDASYRALAKIYGARGNRAAEDTLGDAAALNGGYGTSYAVSAAQQARNQYNQELAALIPDLEERAFSRAQTTYNVLRDADNNDYDKYRDLMSDYQFGLNYDYQIDRDAVADRQWQKNYDLDLAQFEWSKKDSAGSGGSGGGGGRRSCGGGGGYYSSSSSSGYPERTNPNIAAAQQKGKSMTEYYKKLGYGKKKNSGSPNR